MVSDDFGAIVAIMRKFYGREIVDQKIELAQKKFDARENGVCCDCFESPAISGESKFHMLCSKCKAQAESELRGI